jgi:tRNA threonylcarbamoyl adenosine modification protein YeaZ
VILGIDTSLGTAVALVDPDGVVRAEVASDNPLGHAEVIGDLLVQATDAAATTAAYGSGMPASGDDPITHVAAGMGPGPFTGLRIGIAAARTFALARGIPVVPVPSHDAIALGVLLAAEMEGAETGRFAVVTDARRKEFAYTVYRGLDGDGLPTRETQPALVPRDQLDGRLDELAAARVEATSVSAALLALAAARAVAAGRTLATAEPLYLRSPDVTVGHTPKRVSA